MLRGSRSLTLRPHFGDIPRAPRVARPQAAPPLRSHLACSKGREPAICTLTLVPSRMLWGSRTRTLRAHFGAIPHALKVARL